MCQNKICICENTLFGIYFISLLRSKSKLYNYSGIYEFSRKMRGAMVISSKSKQKIEYNCSDHRGWFNYNERNHMNARDLKN